MGVKSQVLEDTEIAQLLIDAGFRGDAAIVAFAVIIGESGGDAWAINMNTHDPTSVSYLSLDKGLVQWNDYWWPDFARTSDPFVPELAVQKFFEVSKGNNFTPWNAYKNHSFVRHVERAYAAFSAL